MRRNAENYARRVLRMIRVNGRTTRQIMDDVEALVNRDMPDDNDARAINDELDRLISRQFELARRGAPGTPARPSEEKRSKYGNRKTEYAGRRFDSVHEAEVYKELELRVRAGELRGVICQQAFLLPGGVKYIADFVTLNQDGTYSVIDAKSEATRRDKVYRIKRRQMRECLGIEILEI